MKLLCNSRVLCYLLILLVLWPGTGMAQNGNGKLNEHQELSVNTISNDTAAIHQILLLADSLRYSNADSFKKLSTLALRQSWVMKYAPGIYDGLNKLGLYYRDRGAQDSAITFFEQAIPYAQSVRGKSKVYILYNNIGNAYADLGKYEQALENFYHALEASSRENAEATAEEKVGIYINIGTLWGRLKESEHALGAFGMAENIAQKMPNTDRLMLVYLNLGTLYYTNKNWKKAEEYYKKGLRMAQEHKLKGYEIYSYTFLARLYVDWHMPENAMTHIRAAFMLLKTYPSTAHMWLQVQSTLGAVYLTLKDYDRAKTTLQAALKRAEEGKLRELIAGIEPDVAEAYAATGDFREAFEHMKRYAFLKDTFFEQEKTRSLKVWMQSRMNEKDKTMLAQQLHITQQKSQLQTKNFWIIGIVICTILIVVVCVVLVRSYRHKQKLQQSAIFQMQQEQEINQLKAQIRGEEQERNRIAQELHDGIASQLWAIKLNVDSLQQQDHLNSLQQHSLQAIHQQLEETTHDVRKTAHNLMPDLLLEEGLATALASLCDKTAKNTGLEVLFQEYGIIPRMNEEIELSLYRMIQELIQNVLKHAQGVTQLLVQVSCIGTLLNITVEDNGSGFSEEEQRAEKGMGLANIQKRVKVLQGHIDVQSTKGKGTTLYLEFDIQHLL